MCVGLLGGLRAQAPPRKKCSSVIKANKWGTYDQIIRNPQIYSLHLFLRIRYWYLPSTCILVAYARACLYLQQLAIRVLLTVLVHTYLYLEDVKIGHKDEH